MIHHAATYNAEHFATLSAIEERHFWFAARGALIETVARSMASFHEPGRRALEIGCGTGMLLRRLVQAHPNGPFVGMDVLAEGLDFARQYAFCPLVQGDALHPPFGEVYDWVGMFDIIEHLRDDVEALRAARSVTNEGGALVLTVPAHPELWSDYDDACCHCRRYTRLELLHKLAQAGYDVEYLTSIMVSLLPLVWIRRKLRDFFHRLSEGSKDSSADIVRRELRVSSLQAPLRALLKLEIPLIARRKCLPMGTSFLAVARAGPR